MEPGTRHSPSGARQPPDPHPPSSKATTTIMGAKLATAAVARWPQLSDPARLALVTMCLVAHDKGTARTPAATYYGGHRDLAITLHGSADEATLHRVKRAVKELRDAGAVVIAQPACRGRTAVYRLDVQAQANQDQLI